MGPFLVKRILTLIATLIGASVVVFLVLEILPGNAAEIMMGPDASPEAVAGAGRQARPGPARDGTLLALGHRHAHRRAGRQLRLQLPGGRPDARAADADRAAGLHGDEPDHGAGAGGGHLRRGTPQQAGRCRADGPDAGRHRDSQLLVRDPADPVLLGQAAMVLGRRLPGLERRRRPGPAVAAAAGPVAGRGAVRDPGAHHALGRARGDARRLRAHRPGQGPVAARDAVGPCAAQRDDSRSSP